MKSLCNRYIKNNLFNKTLVIYSFITIIAIFLLTTVFLRYYTNNQIQNEKNIHSEVIFNIEKVFEEQERVVNSIANGINTQPKIIEEIRVLNENSYEEYLSYKLDKFSLTNVKQIDLKYLIDTVLSNRNDVLAVVINNKDNNYNTEIVLNYDKWYSYKNNSIENGYLRNISRPIKSIYSSNIIGYIDVYFDLGNLNSIIKQSNIKGDILIFNKYNNIVFSSDKNISRKNINLVKSYVSKEFNNLKNEINIKKEVQSGFTYLSIIDEFDLNINKEKQRIIYISIICITFIIFFTYMIINYYSQKLKNIVNKINKLEEGDLNTRFNIKNKEDELDTIAISIDKMTESLQDSINKKYIAEVSQKQSELNALQSQIKPHFLYNTLEVIRMCALSNKNKEVADMIYNLASIFRYSTYNNKSLVSLKEEIKYTKMYLELCSIRYKGILNYKIETNDVDLDLLIPKFTIQPLVENSINHGLKKDSSENLIYISINKEQDFINIKITDNGNGIEDYKLYELKKKIENNIQNNTSIGVMNVNNRIKLRFGEDYGIDIDSKLNIGTKIIIKIPITKEGVYNV